jgi:hypothetical protein
MIIGNALKRIRNEAEFNNGSFCIDGAEGTGSFLSQS